MMKLIGGGTFGKTYLLKDYEPQIVMKEILVFCDRIDQQVELETLRELMHPNVVKYMESPLEFGYQSANLLIFMEFCEEGPLRNVITCPNINYSVATIAQWALEIFTALVYLHKEKNIAHRDIKPENIFVTKDFVLKIGDFGVIKRFGTDDAMRSTNIGTPSYMAPEMSNGSELEIEDIFKFDVFAAGLVLWEVIKRENLRLVVKRIEFEEASCKNVKRLYRLVNNCSSPTINIKERWNSEKTHKELIQLVELFSTFHVLPEFNIEQKTVREPEGLCRVEEHNDTMTPPSILTFGATKVTPGDPEEHQEKEKKTNKKNDSFMLNWLPKFTTKRAFKNFSIKMEAIDDKKECKSLKLLAKVEHTDVNEVRETLCKRLSMTLFETMSDVTREHFVEHVQDLFLSVVKKNKGRFYSQEWERSYLQGYFKRYFGESSQEMAAELRQSYELFLHLLAFDFNLQNHCIQFALHVMLHCGQLTFSWRQLVDLLDLAAHNIGEISKVFTQRTVCPISYFDDSRTEWCNEYDLFFRKDLTEFRIVDQKASNLRSEHGHHVIDIEAIRRALDEKRKSVLKYAFQELPIRVDLVKLLQVFLNKAYTQRNGAHGFTSIKQIKVFKRVPRCAEKIMEVARGCSAETRFSEFIYFWDSLPKGYVSRKCSCPSPCPVESFPENRNLPDELKIEYSLCKRENQHEFLRNVALFERAFRLLHGWEEIHLHGVIRLYLIEAFLNEIEKLQNPSIEFTFLHVKEKIRPDSKKFENFCHEGSLDNRKRSGLRIGLKKPHVNTFWNHNFRLESFYENCLVEAIGLVHIRLDELYVFLRRSARFVRDVENVMFFSKIEFMKIEKLYVEDMRNLIKTFWARKKRIRSRELFVKSSTENKLHWVEVGGRDGKKDE